MVPTAVSRKQGDKEINRKTKNVQLKKYYNRSDKLNPPVCVEPSAS